MQYTEEYLCISRVSTTPKMIDGLKVMRITEGFLIVVATVYLVN